jgi:phosphatidate cytidylyltransferase
MLAAGLVIFVSDTLTAHGNTILHIPSPSGSPSPPAAILNIAAQLGDLLESAIKRGAGVKDSGTMLPVTASDRIDAHPGRVWFILLLKDHFNFSRF